MDFVSENTAPVHPAFMEAVVKANDGFALNFEKDAWTERAVERLRDFFETDLMAYPAITGTATNAIALATMVPTWGSILCHREAHIQTQECGAPEMYTGGARQILLPGEHGKIDPKGLRQYLEDAEFSTAYAVQPAALSLTQQTEAGTVYEVAELEELCGIAKSFGLKVHMDGARFANAVAAIGCTPAEMSWKAGVDILCLGATKSGALGAEVIVSFDPELHEKHTYVRKRGGHLIPKSRFLSAQIEAFIEDDLWLKNARHGNAMARLLADGLVTCPEATVVHPVEGNEVFLELPDAVADALEAKGFKFTRNWCKRPPHHRFVFSWASSSDDVAMLVAACRGN